MKRSALLFVVALLLTAQAISARAAVVATGNVSPVNPAEWTSSTYGYVGAFAEGTLTVDSGSGVRSSRASVGYNGTGLVTVTGAGSTWKNSWYVIVGDRNNGILYVTDGGAVSDRAGTTPVPGYSDGAGYIGDASGSTGTATVDGVGSTWTNTGALFVGNCGSGTLNVTDGGTVSSTKGYIAVASTSTGIATVSGIGSTWSNSSDLFVGGWDIDSSDNGCGTLKILAGGTVTDTRGRIGFQSSSSTCMATIDGTGSKWINSSSLIVGSQGSGTMTISNGGIVSNTSGKIGSQSTGAVTVDGTGSTWNNSGTLTVASFGTGSLNVTSGATVTNTSGYIGYNSASSGTVTVDGSGSTWTTSGSLYVGNSGNGTLNITSGGAVAVTDTTYVAYNAGSTGKIDFGAGGGTLTTGTLNALPTQITGIGTIIAHGIVGDFNLLFDSTSSGTLAFNDLPGQSITVNLDMSSPKSNGDLYAGWKSNGSLSIYNGATVNSRSGYIGYLAESSGVATVDGPGSTWNNTSSLYIGNSGSAMLNISSGSTVINGSGYIGYNSGSTGTVTIDGAASTWNNNTSLYVGYSGSGTLNINGGSTVTVADTTYVAKNTGSTGTINFGAGGGKLITGTLNTLPTQITGTGTIIAHGIVGDLDLLFDSTACQTLVFDDLPGQNITVNLDLSSSSSNGDLYAGWKSNGSLSIYNGITVNSRSGYIGYLPGSSGVATVDGPGSTWNNSSSLYIGNAGNAMLHITNGSNVTNNNGFIGFGYSPDSTGTVMVDGVGSTWTNNNLYVGYYGGDGTLSILNGGLVTVAGTLIIDYYQDGDGFINIADGGMLALFGEADDSLADFLGLIGGTDAIRYWDYSISDWADIAGATCGDDYTLAYQTEGDLAGYTVLTASVPDTIAGDANHDGVVNEADAAVLAAYWQKNQGAFWGMGDFNGDGAVDDADATLMAANWGKSADSAVPEPAVAVGLLGMCFAGIAAFLRRTSAIASLPSSGHELSRKNTA